MDLMHNKPVDRETLLSLEDAIHAEDGAVTDFDSLTSHIFAPGVYVRRFDLLAGTVVVGKIHLHSHVNILLSGVVTVGCEFHTTTFAGPRVWVSEAGIKRAVYTLEDAIWLTVHANPDDVEDLDIIERQHIAADYPTLEAEMNKRLELKV